MRLLILFLIFSSSFSHALNLDKLDKEDIEIFSSSLIRECVAEMLVKTREKEVHVGRHKSDGLEQAAWVIYDPINDAYSCDHWDPKHNTENSVEFRGSLPKNVVAILHTHTINSKKRMSPVDMKTTKKLNMSFYAIDARQRWVLKSYIDEEGKAKQRQVGPGKLKLLYRAIDS